MLLGPIFSFDLVTSARRRRYYLLRALYAFVLAALIWTIFSDHGAGTQVSIHEAAALAESFFTAMSVVQLLAVLMLGPALAAGTVALERERRTIEYLFVTDLSNSEIVLGKLASRLLHLGFLVAVGLPVMALAMLFGGISPEQLATLFAVTLSTMVAVIALSVAVSVWSARARDAVVRSYLAVFALVALPPCLANLWRELMGYSSVSQAVPWILQQLWEANPFYVFELLQTAGTWPSVLKIVSCHLAFAGVCAALALGAVRRVHLNEMGRAPKTARRRRWRGELGDRPMLWKELFADQARLRLGILGRLVIGTIAAGYFLLAVSFAWSPTDGGMRPWQLEEFAAWTTALLSLGLILIAARAASSITSEKDRQCWEPLLLTSLTPSEIIGGKIWGNLYAARGLALLVSFAWLLQLVSYPDYLIVIPFDLATLGVLMLFCSSLGVLFSLYSRDSLRAIATTLAVGIVVGGGYIFCCVLVLIPSGGPGRGSEIIFAACMPFLLVFPTIVYAESHQQYSTTEVGLTAAYVIGMIGYAVASLLIWLSCVQSLAQTAQGVPELASRAGSPRRN